MNKPPTITDAQADEIYRRLPKKYKMIFALARETGSRISDILALKIRDIANPMRIYESKTGKIRTHEISDWLYAELRASSDRHGSHYIFQSTRRGKNKRREKTHVARSTYHRALQRAILNTGYKISSHSLRKLYAHAVYAKTQNLQAVQSALGHKYVRDTATYLDLDIESLIEGAMGASEKEKTQKNQSERQTPSVAKKIRDIFSGFATWIKKLIRFIKF